MAEFNRELQDLQERAARKQRLQGMVSGLEVQRDTLKGEVKRLDRERRMEQADVDRLEGHSLAAWFFALTGQKEERLDKERAEAYAAAVRYDAAKAQLDAVEQQLAQARRELAGLSNVEGEMTQLLEEQRRVIKESDPVNGAKILELEEREAILDAQLNEIREGLAAGQDVLFQVGRIEEKLSSAEGWGTWDLIGGGMLSSMAKHSALDEAQQMVEWLQILLRKFRTELTDVQIFADLQLQTDGFLRFTDCFFDNIFSDWAALDHIRASQSQVADVRRQVESVLYQLNWMQQQAEEERGVVEEEITRLLTGQG